VLLDLDGQARMDLGMLLDCDGATDLGSFLRTFIGVERARVCAKFELCGASANRRDTTGRRDHGL
jgi:hypothetical protein